MNINEMEDWEFGAVGIANPKKSTLKRYFELILLTENLKGDIAEFGVSKGNSLITTGLITDNTSKEKTILGFDTFHGFPEFTKFDQFEFFEEMFKNDQISKSHYKKIQKNKNYITVRGGTTQPGEISNSRDFSDTSIELVQRKIDFFGLTKRVKLVTGDFTKNLDEKIKDFSFALILIDSDLFQSYAKILPIIWEKLVPGGYIYLDEYYSLKFPGPKLAVDTFLKKENCELIRLPDWLDFERWALYKNT